MTSLLPPQFLFHYAIPVRHNARLPRKGPKLLQLTEKDSCPHLGALDKSPRIGQVRLAWNSAGLGVSVEVTGKQRQPRAVSGVPEISDGLQIWIDTRNTQTIHRASRFCHHFCLLPVGMTGKQPTVVQVPIARAKEEAPLSSPADFRIAAEVSKSGYQLEAWLPASALHGYDPEANPRLGFYYAILDEELGHEFLSVGSEFPVTYDPSMWATLDLVKG